MHLPRTVPAHPRSLPSSLSCLLVCLLLVAAAPARPAAAQPARAETAAVEAALPALERYIQDFMARAGIPGIAIGIVAGEELVYAKGFGVRRLGGTDPVDPATLFQIGSITKSFAAGTEAVLVDRGLIAWDDRVIDHVPEFRMQDPWVTREFRVIDLLAQRSGLTPYALGEMIELGYDRPAMVAAIRELEPISSFRTTFGYQNVMHLVTERLVINVTGAPSWEDFLRQAILDPLGMASTGNTAGQIAASPNHASGHSRTGGAHPIPFHPPFYNAGAAGNLNSNIADMANWLALQINRGSHRGRQVIDEAALTHTWLPQVAVVPGSSYANGLVLSTDGAGRVVWHNGGTTGFASFMGFDPDRKVGIVVLTNLALPGAGDAIGNRFLDAVRGLPETDHGGALLARIAEMDAAQDAILQTPPADPRPPRPMADYAGAYDNPIYGKVSVAESGPAELSLTIGPLPTRVRLTPWSGDSFAVHFPDHRDRGMTDPMGFVQFEPGVLDRIRAFSLDLDTGDQDSPLRPRFLRAAE